MINHPATPPMTQMSRVMTLMGIGGETTRFVTNNSSTPTTALMASPTHPASDSISVVSRAKINNATANMTTTASTSNSMSNHFSREQECLPANKRVGGGLPLFASCREGLSSRKLGEEDEQRLSRRRRPYLLHLPRSSVSSSACSNSPPLSHL